MDSRLDFPLTVGTEPYCRTMPKVRVSAVRVSSLLANRNMDADALAAFLRPLEAAGVDFAVCAPINVDWDAALETLAGVRDLVH